MARLRGVLIGHQLLDLPRPVDNDGLEALHQFFVFFGGVHIAEILIGNVEILHALCDITGLSDEGHEVVQIARELFFDVVRPVALAEQLGAGVIHHGQKLVKRVAVTETSHDILVNVIHRDLLCGVALDEESDLVVLNCGFGSCKGLNLLFINLFIKSQIGGNYPNI